MAMLLALLFVAVVGVTAGESYRSHAPLLVSPPASAPAEDQLISNWTSSNETDYSYGYYYDNVGHKRGIERPECFFEEYTGACCVRAGMHGNTFRTCIEVGVQLSEMKASAVLHINDRELLSKSVEAGKVCATIPPPLPPTKVCLNIYYGVASWSQKKIDVCAAVELANIVHVRFDCFRFAEGKFQHHAEIMPEKFGLLNVSWQNGKPQFQIVSQPIPSNVTKWIHEQWTKIKNAFRQKSGKFISWLFRRRNLIHHEPALP